MPPGTFHGSQGAPGDDRMGRRVEKADSLVICAKEPGYTCSIAWSSFIPLHGLGGGRGFGTGNEVVRFARLSPFNRRCSVVVPRPDRRREQHAWRRRCFVELVRDRRFQSGLGERRHKFRSVLYSELDCTFGDRDPLSPMLSRPQSDRKKLLALQSSDLGGSICRACGNWNT